MREHEIQLEFDVINAYKANERDMYDQKNRQCQTMIVANSIMLSALISILIQCIIPNKTLECVKIVLSITGSISLGFLALSIIFYVKVIVKCTTFMDSRGKYHAQQWKNVKDRIIRESEPESIIETTDNNEEKMDEKYKKELEKKMNSTLSFSEQRNEQDEKKFLLESTIEHYIVEDVVESNDDIELANCNNENERENTSNELSGTFEEFWAKYCKTYDNFGTQYFYWGTVFLLGNLIVYNYEYFYHNYESYIGAILSAIIIGLHVCFAFYLYVLQMINRRNIYIYIYICTIITIVCSLLLLLC